MADLDEDAIHLSASHDSTGQIEHDLSDETQDFRFLNNLALYVQRICNRSFSSFASGVIPY